VKSPVSTAGQRPRMRELPERCRDGRVVGADEVGEALGVRAGGTTMPSRCTLPQRSARRQGSAGAVIDAVAVRDR
jgi:hypothetical protein